MGFSKEHRRVLTAMYNGIKLKKMGSGQPLDDGFVLKSEKSGKVGFSEVLTSTVSYLESNGFIEFNPDGYIITTDGKVRIGVEKRKKKSKKKAKEGA